MKELFSINGSCFCKNINYIFNSSKKINEIKVRACTCSFCTKHGNRYTSDPDGELIIFIKNCKAIKKLKFATETAEFYICMDCGSVPFIISDIIGKTYAVINVNTFE